TITISGEHFRIDKTQVYFNNIEAKITSINNTQIATVIPPGLKDKNVEIKVIVASQKVISNQYFISDVPQIAAINPKNGTWNDIITIEGNNFSKDISLNTVRFDETVAEIVEANQTSLKVMVPANLLTETSKISVEVRTQIGASGEDFTLNQPEIISFDPMLATFRDTVTISGQNFNPMPQNNRAFLGEVEAVVTEAKASELRIIVPDEFQSELGKTKIELKTGNMNTISNNDFEMYLHKITGVKDSINRNESLIIYGDYFNPTASLNTVHVNGIFKEVINASKNSLAVGFPENLHDGENILDIKVQIGGREVNQNESILVFEPWERVMDFGGGLRRYAISFSANGKGYFGGGLDANGYQRDFYEYDVESNSWMRKSDIPFTSAGWVNWSTDTKGYTLEKKHLWAYDPIIGQWNQLKDFPGNPEWGQSYFSIGDKLYLGTGFSDNGKYSEFWDYDISSDTWTIKASFPFATAFGVGFAINNKGYIATGYDNPYIYEYDSDVDI
ncbi:MAG: IPT/TIG domain-containing protein, partial [Flavobacteriaceae bacterium]|nr:IPT/TIG domain-containing protein [Flavobacteriaceae bacterium]